MQLGHYPEKYRVFIWRFLLQLPENTAAFSDLGIHRVMEFYLLILCSETGNPCFI